MPINETPNGKLILLPRKYFSDRSIGKKIKLDQYPELMELSDPDRLNDLRLGNNREMILKAAIGRNNKQLK